MNVLALIEVKRQPDGALPSELLQLAYQASRRGRIVLVLKGVSPFDVDKEIDRLVKRMPLDIPGLLYVRADDLGKLADASAAANMIFVSAETELYWRSAFQLGLRRTRPPQDARDVLHRIARPARLEDLYVRSNARHSKPH